MSLQLPSQGSRSSLNLALQMGESFVNSRTSGLHEIYSRPQGYMDEIDETRSVNTTRAPSMRHFAPEILFSTKSSDSLLSVSTGRSLTRSIAGSESRQAAYRTHRGPVHSRPVSTHSSIVDVLHHGSPNTISVPLDLPRQAAPVSGHSIVHVHYILPPDSDGQPGSVLATVYDGLQMTPMAATEVERYKRSTPWDPTILKNVPQGWTAFVHPEGTRYFVNQKTRTFTEMNICDKEICGNIEYCMHYLLDELQRTIVSRSLTLDMKQVDLVVELKVFGGKSITCCYYFANHRGRCLFWLHDFDPENIISECRVESFSHIMLAIQAQYWKHWDSFPSLCPVTQYLVDELKDMLIYATCDHLTSKESPAVFGAIELREHLSAVDRIQVYPHALALVDQSMQRCHAAIVIGRIMQRFSHNRFVNYR